MSSTVPNVAELVAIYQHIKAHPEQWDQSFWAQKTDCGTAYCFAGHAAVRAGGRPRFGVGDYVSNDEAWLVRLPDGSSEYVRSVAMRALGLGEGDAERLFHQRNDLDDVRRIIEDITGVDPEAAAVTQ